MHGSESPAVVAVPEMLTQASLLEFWKAIRAVFEVLKVVEFQGVLVGEEEEVKADTLSGGHAAGYNIHIWAGCC